MTKSNIPWCDEVWNPTVGCTMACPYCYASKLHNQRHQALDTEPDCGLPECYALPFSVPRCLPERLFMPLKRRKGTTFFVDSMGDLFDPAIPFEFIGQVFEVMAKCQRHTFIILTKRPARMKAWFEWVAKGPETRKRLDLGWALYQAGTWPLPNVQLGVSITNQHDADTRIPLLLQTPAAFRLVSVEPMAGPIDMSAHLGGLDLVICGPCTGPHPLPFRFEWAEDLYQQCRRANVPFFWKLNDGRLPREGA